MLRFCEASAYEDKLPCYVKGLEKTIPFNISPDETFRRSVDIPQAPSTPVANGREDKIFSNYFTLQESRGDTGVSLTFSWAFLTGKPLSKSHRTYAHCASVAERISRRPERGSLISSCTDKSDECSGALTRLWRAAEREMEASEQKSHTVSPPQTVCLKPALQVYMLCSALPGGISCR